MAAASQGTYINPMAALATQMPHAPAPLPNGITSPVVPPTSGEHPQPCPAPHFPSLPCYFPIPYPVMVPLCSLVSFCFFPYIILNLHFFFSTSFLFLPKFTDASPFLSKMSYLLLLFSNTFHISVHILTILYGQFLILNALYWHYIFQAPFTCPKYHYLILTCPSPVIISLALFTPFLHTPTCTSHPCIKCCWWLFHWLTKIPQ